MYGFMLTKEFVESINSDDGMVITLDKKEVETLKNILIVTKDGKDLDRRNMQYLSDMVIGRIEGLNRGNKKWDDNDIQEFIDYLEGCYTGTTKEPYSSLCIHRYVTNDAGYVSIEKYSLRKYLKKYRDGEIEYEGTMGVNRERILGKVLQYFNGKYRFNL